MKKPKPAFSKASVSCPKCRANTRVTRTRKEGINVRRERICPRGHTHESVEVAAKPRPRLTHSQSARLRWSS